MVCTTSVCRTTVSGLNLTVAKSGTTNRKHTMKIPYVNRYVLLSNQDKMNILENARRLCTVRFQDQTYGLIPNISLYVICIIYYASEPGEVGVAK